MHSERILGPSYIPTDEDVFELRTVPESPNLLPFPPSNLLIDGRLIVDICTSEREQDQYSEICNLAKTITSIVIPVDLCSYTQSTPKGIKKNKLLETMAVFRSIVNWPCKERPMIILLFHRFKVFQSWLVKHPLSRCFPGYSDRNPAEFAAQYITEQFASYNRGRFPLRSHMVEWGNFAALDFIFSDLRWTLTPKLAPRMTV